MEISRGGQLVFLGHRRQKVILGGDLLPKLSRTLHRRVDLPAELRLRIKFRQPKVEIVSIGNLCQSCYSELEICIHKEDHGHAYT